MTMLKVNIAEAKAHLSHYLKRVEEGETVILCRRNQPIAELRAIGQRDQEPRSFGLGEGLYRVDERFFESLDDELLALFEGEPVSASKKS
jgi:antitoxin (DNA-binding transcriptional repressor) of toxin-antitoxin stability system